MRSTDPCNLMFPLIVLRTGRLPAAVSGPMDAHVGRTMTDKDRNRGNRLYTIWSAIYLRPKNMMKVIGFKLFLGSFNPSFVSRTMHHTTFNKHLASLYHGAKASMLADIKVRKEGCNVLG